MTGHEALEALSTAYEQAGYRVRKLKLTFRLFGRAVEATVVRDGHVYNGTEWALTYRRLVRQVQKVYAVPSGETGGT